MGGAPSIGKQLQILSRYHWHLRAIPYHKKTTSKQRWSLINLVLLFFCLFGKKSRSIDHFHSILLLYLCMCCDDAKKEERSMFSDGRRCYLLFRLINNSPPSCSSILHHLISNTKVKEGEKEEVNRLSTDTRRTRRRQCPSTGLHQSSQLNLRPRRIISELKKSLMMLLTLINSSRVWKSV